MVVGRKTLPANNVMELIAWLKANPDKATSGTIGVGSPSHVGGIYFQKLTGTQFQFVPYRGAAPAMSGSGGRPYRSAIVAEASRRAAASAQRQVKAFASWARPAGSSARYPDQRGGRACRVPYFVLAGVLGAQGHAERRRRQAQCRDGRRFRRRHSAPAAADLGQEILPREQQTPEALGAYHKAEIEKWWPIIKAAGIKAE